MHPADKRVTINSWCILFEVDVNRDDAHSVIRERPDPERVVVPDWLRRHRLDDHVAMLVEDSVLDVLQRREQRILRRVEVLDEDVVHAVRAERPAVPRDVRVDGRRLRH